MAVQSLVIEASTAVHQIGVLEGDRFATFFSSTEGTLMGFFSILSQFSSDFHYDEIIFCEGPGQMLGIRSAIMFTRIAKIIHPHIRTYTYNNLVLVDRIRNRLLLPIEGLLCVRKGQTQHYIFEDDHIFPINNETLWCRTNPIYRLATHHHEMPDRALPITYDLRNHGDILRTVITPNEAIETTYDSQNEYKKWTPPHFISSAKNSKKD
ncbi:MAG: hypothetical protein LBR92_02365 [Puniceicoccales bacterium]|jgi:hypothetical protein|nr:hypothetical protein [Puniceicoccales bacterium]